jgi:8-oxo-dGTP pyrophosphatase MutT (NUDIX family)
MTSRNSNPPEVIEAAGGLLWRQTSSGPQIALIHRQRYNDWSLPKGTRHPGETWQQTALREVHEETGCLAELGEFAGGQTYNLYGAPKVVLYWHMRIAEDRGFTPNQEVDQLDWFSLDDARQVMSYPAEIALLPEA